MTKEEYRQERLDPRWQKRRLEIMQRDGFKCRDCESNKETLNVHHAYYVKGRRCWSYPDFALETLCHGCHNDRHKCTEDNENALDSDTEEKLSVISEWEIDLDWIMNGNPECGALWFMAAEINQALRYYPQMELFKKIEGFVSDLRHQSEASK